MEIELKSLIEAWNVCKNSLLADPNSYREAFNYIEKFKQTSTNILEIGFYLASQREIDAELIYFGVQLIIHAIKFKWNNTNVSDQIKFDIRSKLFNIIFDESTPGSNRFLNGPNYLKNAACLAMIELLKREWPQNWPTFLSEIFEISTRSFNQKCLVFIILKYIAEEFLETENVSSSNLPTQRRRDINHYLNLNMLQIYSFLIENLEFFYNYLLQNESAFLTKSTETESVINLINVCLDSFNCFINWFSFEHLFSKNFLLINITLNFLNHEKLSINSAKCLISLINRKGTSEERKPLLGLFEEAILSQIINRISNSLNNKELTKYLIQILIGMGFHLSALWSTANFQKPSQFSVFLKVIFEITFSPNKYFSFDAIQLWNNLLNNEFIQSDSNIVEFLNSFSLMLTQSSILFKHSASSQQENEFQDEFDSEEDYLKFIQKYRSELSKLIKTGASFSFMPFLIHSYDWAVNIFKETNDLSSTDQSGYDSNSLLYLKWDALLCLWTSLMQVANKQMKLNAFKSGDEIIQAKEKTLSILSLCVGSKIKNANYCSFSLSLLSSVITFSEFYESDVKLNIYPKILEKLFEDLVFFKNECILELEQQPSNITRVSRLKHKFNVRRQLAAITLNICKNYAIHLKGIFDSILNKVFEIISCNYSTQMEKVILTQALILSSNQIYSVELQTRLILQLLNPIFEYFSSNEFCQSISTPENFINYVGLNESVEQQQQSIDALAHRKKIFYYTNLYYGILKCMNTEQESENSSLKLPTTIGFNFGCLESLITLLKCFNIVHSSDLKNKVNVNLLAMTDSAKLTALGKDQTASTGVGSNIHSSVTLEANEPDKTIMFFYNTYDTINQLLGLYLLKYKNELLFVTLNQTNLEMITKLGDAIFTCFSDIPNFRIRSIIRYILKSCLINKIDKSAIEKGFLVVKINEMLLEYFFPNIFQRISQTNQMYAELNAKNGNFDQFVKQTTDSEGNLENQVIEENQFTLLCREVVELIKVFLFPSTTGIKNDQGTSSSSTLASASSTSVEYLINMDDNCQLSNNNTDQDIAEQIKIEKDEHTGMSELGMFLLKNNKNIYQSILLFLFEGLTWPDSYCCTRFVRMALTLFEKFSISYEEFNATTMSPYSFVLFLNAPITEHLFKCCLTALQIHGEHSELTSLIMNLGFLIYDKSSSLIQEVLNKNFAQIPNLNKKLFEEYLQKIQSGASTSLLNKENKSNEKLKKDCNQLFKKILQPIIGKNIGQLYKNEIKIKNLQPLNTRKNNSEIRNEEIFNICSLFDPSY